MRDNSLEAFFVLVRAGLWSVGSPDVRIDGTTDWNYIYRLAQEQSVQGIVLRGIEELKAKNKELNVPQMLLLQWIGEVQMIEQRNKEMNGFIAVLIEKLRKNDIYAILVKGQGIAQCYEKPLWRSSGDVDLFLSDENYQKAKELLLPLGKITEPEEVAKKHFAMDIDGWAVELHGTLKSGLSASVERELDRLQEDTFYGGQVRSWMNGQTQIFLLKAENDAFYVFTHILQHFYKEGVGLRQLCDWCRLMWTYKDSLNYGLLEQRIKRAGLMSEWKAFYNLASRYLGMPDFGSGLMVHDSRYDKKADKICEFILEVGNFGHNRDNSYFQKHSYFVQKCISAWRRVKDLCRHATIFPLNSVRFFFGIMYNGIVSTLRGE